MNNDSTLGVTGSSIVIQIAEKCNLGTTKYLISLKKKISTIVISNKFTSWL